MAEGVSPDGVASAHPAAAAPAPDRWDSTPLGPRAAWPLPLRTLADLMLGSPQPMFVAWGPDLILLYNSGYAEILGAHHPAAFGRPYVEVWTEYGDVLAGLVAHVRAGRPVNRPDAIQQRVRDGREEEAHFAVSINPVREGPDGAVAGLFGICIETTAQVAAERLRTEGFKRTQQLFENAPGFIAVFEGPDHVITLANAAFRQLVGDDRELLGLPFREAIPEAADDTDFMQRFGRVFTHGDPLHSHGAHIRWHRNRDGEYEERIGDFVNHPIRTSDGTITGIFCEGVDVTERHRAVEDLRCLNDTLEQRVAEELAARLRSEEALRQSQKMEAIGQLTGGVAHDFNNLLTIIRSSADVLRRLELDEARRRRYLDAIADTADRAARLTAQLLAFARRQTLHPAILNVRDCIEAVIDMLRTVTGARIELVTIFDCPDCYVMVDAVQLETALVNLAANARDAMDGEGRLTITVRSADEGLGVGDLGLGNEAESPNPKSPTAKPHVAISVADTGPGIPPDIIAQIFEPFFTTKEVGKGTGLGLSQVYGFARQSGGGVEVVSEPGQGACFILSLPRVEAPAEAPVAPRTQGEETPADGHVLIVEDNEQVGAFSTELLSDLGYRTSRATNGEAALRMLDGAGGPDAFSVVFTDVVMPGMSGIELGNEIRRRWPGLPVVLTSGYSQALAEEGSQGFELLSKPYSLEDLQRVLRGAGR